jgi:hypothetical protein
MMKWKEGLGFENEVEIILAVVHRRYPFEIFKSTIGNAD